MNEKLYENLKKVINAELKKGTLIHVEVTEVIGTDIVGMEVHTEGGGLAQLKMLISAMATNQHLNKLIKAAAAASEIVHVDATTLNMAHPEEEGGEV